MKIENQAAMSKYMDGWMIGQVSQQRRLFLDNFPIKFESFPMILRELNPIWNKWLAILQWWKIALESSNSSDMIKYSTVQWPLWESFTLEPNDLKVFYFKRISRRRAGFNAHKKVNCTWKHFKSNVRSKLKKWCLSSLDVQ